MEATVNRPVNNSFNRPFLAYFFYIISLFCLTLPAHADFPGGFLEQPDSAQVRDRPTASEIQGFLPDRGEFAFPAPYNTSGVRLTNASDCGNNDCLWPVGYSYWRNTNNHVNSDIMYIFLGLDRNRGGSGPTLFSYNKVTGEVINLGPLFDANSALGWASAEGWYFSASQPTKLYVNDGPRMLRYDILSREFETVFDISVEYGAGYYLWQMHSSDDDRVHSVTVRDSSTYVMLGCGVYNEGTSQFNFFPKAGNFDECHVDKSGRWLMSLEDIDYQYGLEMRIFDLTDASERMVWDQDGAVGHFDMGYGYVVGTDNWNNLPNSIRDWDFSQSSLSGQVVFHNMDWSNPAANHISHTNAKPGIPSAEQYACGSHASRDDSPWANEVVCFRLDGSLDTLVVAPVMTDMNSSVGGDDYSKAPKGNLDITGEYFIWTSNTGGNRVDAFIAKVPSQLLINGTGVGSSEPDVTAPTVTVTSPVNGATVSGSTTLSASANDNVGVTGVQFQLNGVNLGSEDTSAPYSITWDSSSVTSGVHSLTAIARDAAGNTTLSTPVLVTVPGVTTATPEITGITVSNISSSGATINWTTSEFCDSQVEYGLTTSYDNLTTLDTNLVSDHTVVLSGLNPETVYHYRVISKDVNGDVVASADANFSTTPASTTTAVQNVTWTEAVNVAVNTNSLEKTSGCDGCADAGAISQQQITSNGGYLEFTVSGASLVRYIGLTDNPSVTNISIPFGFKLVSGYAEVRENGQYRADVAVANGDVLRVSVQSNTVSYSKNGTVFYTSSTVPSFALFAQSTLTSMNATLDNVVISRSGSGNSVNDSTGGTTNDDGTTTIAVQNVVWTQTANVTVEANALRKTSGCDGCNDAGAVSQQQINSGNGYFEFTVPETGLVRYVGLSDNASGTNYSAIPFAFKIVSNYAEVREYGQYRTDISLAAGDVLRITIQSGVVEYSRNGNPFYTSTSAPVYPLQADVVMSSINAAIESAVIGNAMTQTALGPQDIIWTNPVNVSVDGSSLRKSSGCDGCADASAVSQQQVDSSDGYVEFAVSETGLVRYIGLNDNPTGTSFSTIPFALKIVSGYAEVRENGQYRSDVAIASGDRLRISVQSGLVEYARNGTVFYTSTNTAVGALNVETVISSMNAAIENADISNSNSVYTASSASFRLPQTTHSSATNTRDGGGGPFGPLFLATLSLFALTGKQKT